MPKSKNEDESQDAYGPDFEEIHRLTMDYIKSNIHGPYGPRIRADLKKILDSESQDEDEDARSRSEDSRHRGAQTPSPTPLFMATPEQQKSFTAAFNAELLPHLRTKFYGKS